MLAGSGRSNMRSKYSMNKSYSNREGESISATELANTINARRSGRGFLGQCPAHGDRTPSLYFTDGDSAVLFKCFAGCSSAAVVDAFKRSGLWKPGINKHWQAPQLIATKEESAEVEKRKKQQKAAELWQRAQPIRSGDAAHEYLTVTRRLTLKSIPDDLRFISSLEYWHTNEGNKPQLITKTPALLAAVHSPSGELLAVHRTYLSPSGTKFKPEAHGLPASAPVKKVVGSIGGGAIRLHEPGDTLLVAEGLETALAAHLLSGLPAWAAVSAGNMAALNIPEKITRIYICIDNDDAGRKASKALAGRLLRQGKSVVFCDAESAGALPKGDYADVLDRMRKAC